MPYDIPNVAADENNSHLAHELGGPNKQKPGLQEHYNKFISKLKSVMCKSEAKVIFNSCYTALGIADNTFGSLGITTGGFTGVCSYPQDADKKKYYLPVPKEGGTSKYEEFKPEKEDSKPAESK